MPTQTGVRSANRSKLNFPADAKFPNDVLVDLTPKVHFSAVCMPFPSVRCKQRDDAVRRGVAKKTQVVVRTLPGDCGAAREQRQFVGGQGRRDVGGVVAQGVRKFGAVVERKVGAFACEGRHQMGSIAHQRHARRAFPPMVDWQRVNWPDDWHGVAGRHQRAQLRGPSSKLGGDGAERRRRVDEVDAGYPGCRLVQGDVGVQCAIRMVMREDKLPGVGWSGDIEAYNRQGYIAIHAAFDGAEYPDATRGIIHGCEVLRPWIRLYGEVGRKISEMGVVARITST